MQNFARKKKTGNTKEEVFGCGEGGHAGKMKCLTEVYAESAVATPDGKLEEVLDDT